MGSAVSTVGIVQLLARIVAFSAGTAMALGVLASALRTVVVPRAETSLLTDVVFRGVRRLFDLRLRRLHDWDDQDRVLARYAPFALLTLPAAWMSIMIVAFTPIFWALGSTFPREAFTRSGSSLLTLGFAYGHDVPETVLSFVAATLGLGLVALLISYLPSIYAQFSRREVLVGQLETQAGTPPSPEVLFVRAVRIGWLDQLDDLWQEWGRWFVEVEESHSSNAALPFFRSQHPGRSWLTAAGCVLDAAALRASVLDLPRTFHAELCLRSGYLALRHIADVFDVDHNPEPSPDDPISVSRAEFDELCAHLAAEGVPLRADRDQAWRDFAGWRVNYDVVLLRLCGLIVPPTAPWSSDRSPARYRPRVRRRRR
ncbi:MAG: hypothetical protein JWM47_3771 [Acidimicrobiales bacterium]|nr:hypothetical protein [Acidimicrobiales bacterium]